MMQQMRDAGLEPDMRSYNILVDAAVRGADAAYALEVAEKELPAAGFKPDTVTYNIILFACAEVGSWHVLMNL